jgi:hypothetical protein
LRDDRFGRGRGIADGFQENRTIGHVDAGEQPAAVQRCARHSDKLRCGAVGAQNRSVAVMQRHEIVDRLQRRALARLA